jgi:hypothetical protein
MKNYKVCNIKGFEGLYYIYPDGQIYSLRKKRFLKQQLNGYACYQYMYVTLVGKTKDNILRTAVHRIVAHHYIEPIIYLDKRINGSKLEVNHKDLDKKNNHYTNLEVVTHQQNILHARSEKKWNSGREPGFKHSEEVKQKMREKKYKKVLLIKGDEHIIYDSIEELCQLNGMYRKKFNRLVNSHKTFNGYSVRYLQC